MAIKGAEIAVVKKATSAAVAAAESLEIKKYEDVMDAADFLYKVKTVAAQVVEKKESITKPMNEALKEARKLFKPLEDSLAEAERTGKDKILDWHEKNWKNNKDTDNKIAGAKGWVTVRALPDKAEVVDETLIPREFLVPDIRKIEHALKGGVKVEGVRLVPGGYDLSAGAN